MCRNPIFFLRFQVSGVSSLLVEADSLIEQQTLSLLGIIQF
ncbi:hypothetical protein D1BOALGB6SA_1919 [Olavius sp. associated proteobacterium Delta 1]|nr:hypothetical protein D1BOALGB6SA_1919 [Olavius sp. associated proteobacterium Delta 1]